MRKIKIISVFAVIGFLISFVFGLFSGRGAGSILLRALIFTVIFALLGLGISFLFEKFLMEDGSDLSSESLNVSSNGNKDSVQKGQLVDVTIQDEELPQGNSNNRFVVNDNHQMLNKTDTVQSVSESSVNSEASDSAQPADNGFVPLKNFETVNNFSSTEASSPDVVSGAKASTKPSAVDGELDVLPDMEKLEFGSSSSGSSDSSVMGYEDVTSYSSSSSKKTLEDVGIQDAALMAKAISSALSGEES